MDIRRIEDHELDQMEKIWNTYHTVLTTRNLELSAEMLKNYRMNNPESEYYGYFEKNELIGFLNIRFQPNLIFLEQIATKNTRLREGIGIKLVHYLENLIRIDQNRKKIELTVMIDNLPSLNFFVNEGFRVNSINIMPGFDDCDNPSENLRLVEYSMTKRYNSG